MGLLAILVGCGGGAGVDRTPPSISNPRVSPQELDFYGGEVAVSAEVSDSSGVEAVWAVVEGPGGSQTVELAQGEGESWSGAFEVEGNLGEEPVEYKIYIRARDKAGNETPEPGVPEEGLTVTVRATSRPPQPPSL